MKTSTAKLVALVAVGGLFGGAAVGEDEVAVGKPAPNFVLPTGDGEKTFELASLKGKQPVVVVFSRAHWCPFCTAHMRALQKSYPKIKELGGELVVVFREEKTLDGVATSRKQAEADFVMVSDLDKAKTAAYSPEGFAVYVVDEAGNVSAVLPGTKAKRPSTESILAALEKVAKKKE